MTTHYEKILSEIRINKDPIHYLITLYHISSDPKLLYLSRQTSQRFGELPLDIVPEDLATRFIEAYIHLAIELLSSGHEKFEDCASWSSYSVIKKELFDEIRKHPSPYDY